MDRQQFQVLYRQFLFRLADLDLLSPQGDLTRLLGQFAAVLILAGLLFALGTMGLDGRIPRAELLVRAWPLEHTLIATTMLAAGLFAVLSWDSTFPDRRDAMVLGPLPVRPRTLFVSKTAATASALSVTVAALNVPTALLLPLALAPPGASLLDLAFSIAPYRTLAAFAATMSGAGAFVYGAVLAVQGLAAQVLPRRPFLRMSAFLQMAAFCLFVSVYFLQPQLASPGALKSPENRRVAERLPSYWFLALFQELNGSPHTSLEGLAGRAWIGIAAALAGTAVAYVMSYRRTLRKIVEEPDILPGTSAPRGLPRFGGPLETAILHFSIRTLLRSRQHRLMLAFYIGTGFAAQILFMNTPRAREMLREANAPQLFTSLLMMCAVVVGTRVAFAVPLEPRANWIFRLTEVNAARRYLRAAARPMFVLGAAPVWLISAAFFLSAWPWRPAALHLGLLALWGALVAWTCVGGFRKIPFTCTWLPGRSYFHMAFLGALGLLFLLGKAAAFELKALDSPADYARAAAVLAVAAVAARLRAEWLVSAEGAIVQYKQTEPPAIQGLGLHRDGILPDERSGPQD